MPAREQLLEEFERYRSYYARQRIEAGVPSIFEVWWAAHIDALKQLNAETADPQLTDWIRDPSLQRWFSPELIYKRMCEEISMCRSCELHQHRTKTVPGNGPLRANVMVVGEAPGADEDAIGIPFVGRAGHELFEEILMKGFNWPRNRIFVANTLKCVVGTTKISSTGTEIAYRRPYNGPVITIKSRDQLTCTPNHPVLTTRGLLPAGELVEGDELIRCTLREHVRRADPHVCHIPTTAQETFDTLALASIGQRIAGADMDFHGDGRDGEVQVVRPNGQLRNRIEAPTLQHLADLMLEGPDGASAFLECISSTSLAKLHGPRIPTLAAHRRVRAVCEPAAFLQAGLGHAGDHSGASATEFNPGLNEVLLEPTLADRELLRKALEPFASEVALDKVIEIHRDTYSGHVYNLQTDCGWFTASGYIVSNCRPPNNREPQPSEVAACHHFLQRQVALVNPKLILATGKHAASWFIEGFTTDHKLDQVLGKVHWYGHIPLVVMPHPSAIMRQKNMQEKTPYDYGLKAHEAIQMAGQIVGYDHTAEFWVR